MDPGPDALNTIGLLCYALFKYIIFECQWQKLICAPNISLFENRHLKLINNENNPPEHTGNEASTLSKCI